MLAALVVFAYAHWTMEAEYHSIFQCEIAVRFTAYNRLRKKKQENMAV